MVADHGHDVAVELAGTVAQQQIVQAVVVLRDEDHQTLTARLVKQPILHLEALAQLGHGALERHLVGHQLGHGRSAIAEKTCPATRVGVLVGVEDVRAVAVQHLRQGGDDAAPIGQETSNVARSIPVGLIASLIRGTLYGCHTLAQPLGPSANASSIRFTR